MFLLPTWLNTRSNSPETRRGTEYNFFPSLEYSNRRKGKPSPGVVVISGKVKIQEQPEAEERSEKIAEAIPIVINKNNKIAERLNAIVTTDIKARPAFKNELAYLSRSDAHHDLGDLFKDTMYKKDAKISRAFDSALPSQATVAFHEGDALASVVISATNFSGSTINIHTGNNKQEEYLLEALNEVPDCTNNAKNENFSTFAVGVGGDTIFKYRVVRFVTKCSNNKSFKGEDLDTIACKSNFGSTFVTNTKLGEEARQAAIIVDFSQHHFIEDLTVGSKDEFQVHYLMTPEVVNDPAGKPNVNNKSLFGLPDNGVRLISYVQTDPQPLSYTNYDDSDPSTSNNFFSNYDFTLSPIKQIFTKQKAEKLIATLNISYDGGTGKPLTDTIEDSKGENSITTVLGYLKKILAQIQGDGGSPIQKFNFNSKIQQKRGGDWFQALSCLTAKNRDFTQILPDNGRKTVPIPATCPVYLVTHDRIAVAFALLNGVNVIYLDYYGRIFIFKNGGDPTLKSSGKSMEEILYDGIRTNWLGTDKLTTLLTTAKVYNDVRNEYIKQSSTNFITTCTDLKTSIKNINVSDDSFQKSITNIVRSLFTEAVKLVFTTINLIDIQEDYSYISNAANINNLNAERKDYNSRKQELVVKFSKALNNVKCIQDRFGIMTASTKALFDVTDTAKFTAVIPAWIDSNSKKLDVYRVANNLLTTGADGEFNLNRLISIFSSGKIEKRETDSNIFLPFIQSLADEYKILIIDNVNELVDKTSAYYNEVVVNARAGRTGISSQKFYYNGLANLLYESIVFLKTNRSLNPKEPVDSNITTIKNLITNNNKESVFIPQSTSTDNLLLREDYDDLEVLKNAGKFSGNTENAIDALSGGQRYVDLSTQPRKESAICDLSVKQVTWTLLTALLLESGTFCENIIRRVKAERIVDADLDNINLDEEGNSLLIENIRNRIGLYTTIGDYTIGAAGTAAELVAYQLDSLTPSIGLAIASVTIVTEYLWRAHMKKGGGDKDSSTTPTSTSTLIPTPNVDPLLDFNLCFHPLTPIYSMLTSYYNILGQKSETDPFFYTYFTYINILEKMKRTLEEKYLNDVKNKVNVMSAYMIGLGLYTMLYASHTSELQNKEILSVVQMSQKEYHEFSLKNDGLASTFSGAIHQTPEEEIVGMVLVNNELFNNFINVEVNIKQILEQGTPVENLPTFQVLKDGIFKLMGEIVVKVNADRGTPIAYPPVPTAPTASGIPGISSEESASRAALGQQRYEENKAKGLQEKKPTIEFGAKVVDTSSLFKRTEPGDPNMVTSSTSSQGTRSLGGKKKRKVTRRPRKTYKNKTIKHYRKNKKTRKNLK